MNDKFLTNYSEVDFLDHIKDCFNNCTSFTLSVSFIKKAGLVLIEREIEEALDRGVKGRIITSTYQNFTDIPSLNKFKEWMERYKNFECHLDFKSFGENGFHSKGYIFEYEDKYEIIVGSTNITRFALLKNVEWNISLEDKNKMESLIDAYKEFDYLWSVTPVLNNDLIKDYKIQLDYAIEKWDMDYCDPSQAIIRPNAMQRRALKEIRRFRDMGQTKALVVAATGSGKTYLAAFDARNFDAKKLLFIVHRDAILNDALNTFARVFGTSRSYGLYTGKAQDLDCDFIFATNTMMSKHLDEFKKDQFDYICLDEAHHASASTYKQIMNYFNANFFLGLTATPERMDDDDVFGLFENNVPYELRLNDAINNDLIVPFHYYGIRDVFADYSSENKNVVSKEIARSENIAFIDQEIKKHLPSGKLKAIAFCSSIAHAESMAEKFNDIGYDALALTGKDDLGQRIKAFNDLQDDDENLQIICTVDILNEGIDIPAVNTILFLRPTESSTIFIQQLGRGLRKYPNKEYVTVLDFIGNNYEKSIHIALALGALKKNTGIDKPALRELVDTSYSGLGIKGVEIHIDKLAREEMIKFIDNTNFNRIQYLTKDYNNFKKYLDTKTYPKHMDYLNCDFAPDILRFMRSKTGGQINKSYYKFLKNIDPESICDFTDKQIELVGNISDLLPLARPDEYIILKDVLETSMTQYKDVSEEYSNVDANTYAHALRKLIKMGILSSDNKFIVDQMNSEFEIYLKDLIEYGLTRYSIDFGKYSGKFKLYANYKKTQIMDVLLENGTMFMKGTKFEKDGTTYVFVGLKKDKRKEERTNYKDKFINPSIFQWESENNTTFDNSTGEKLLNTKVVHVFVRKMDIEDGITLPFTYFGTGHFINPRKSFVKQINKDGTESIVDTLLFDIELDNPVSEEFRFEFEVPDELKN